MRKVLAAALGACVVTLVIAGVSAATHEYTGSAESVAIIYKDDAGAATGWQRRVSRKHHRRSEARPGSNYSDANLTVSNYDGHTFDWAFTPAGIHVYDMAIVIVKGGPASAVYTYDYASIEFDDSDNGLSAPTTRRTARTTGQPHPVLLRPEGRGRQLTPGQSDMERPRDPGAFRLQAHSRTGMVSPSLI